MSATHLSRMYEQLRESLRRGTDRGASLIEYALLLALIAVVCVGAVGFLGGETSSLYNDATQEMFYATP